MAVTASQSTRSRASRRQRERDGFTLIATILLISLLSILIVAATVTSQIEEQAQYNASRAELARQNALFGLNQALNQLQTAAGPDRRVTARADILSTNSVPQPTDSGYYADQPQTDSGQSYWTGVWKNTNNDYSGCAGNGLSQIPDPSPSRNPGPGGSFLSYDFLPTGAANATSKTLLMSPTQASPPSRAQLYYNSSQANTPSNVTWLISWPGTALLPPDPTQTLANQNLSIALPIRGGTLVQLTGANQLATVAKNLNAATSANSLLQPSKLTSVSVPKIPILAAQPGSPGTQVAVGVYAYWISDEGIKARVDNPDPYLSITPTTSSLAYLQSMAHFQVSQSSAGSQALAMTASFSASSGAADIRASPVLAPTLAAMGLTDYPNLSWSDFRNNPDLYSADFTVNSLGVIADNFDGGLRKDLTAAFENQTIYWNQFSNVNGQNLLPESLQKLYSINAISGSQIVTNYDTISLDGMRWDSLFLYYNLYKAQMPAPCNVTQSYGYGGIGQGYNDGMSGSSVNTLPTITARIYQELAKNSTLIIDPIIPKVMCWTHSVGLALNQIITPGPPPPPGQNAYDLLFYGNSSMVLYNPWNINLQVPSDGKNEGCIRLWSNIDDVSLQNDFNSFTVGNVSTPITATSAGSSTNTIPGLLGGNDIRTVSTTLNGQLSDTALMPGELRFYGITKANSLGKFPFSSSYAPEPFANEASSSAFPATINNVDSLSTSEELSSSGYSSGVSSGAVYQEFEGTLADSGVNLQSSPSTAIYMVGNPLLEEGFSYVSADYYPSWPNGSLTTLIKDNTVQSYSFPAIGAKQTSTPFNLGSASALSGLGTSSPPKPLLILSLVDRVPGAGSSVSPFPGFVSGGAFLNPLATEQNGSTGDFTKSGKMVSSLQSCTGLNIMNMGTLPTSYADTTWQPGSVGSSIGSPNQIKNIVLRDMPRQPLLSLGQFKNMDCHYWGNSGGDYSKLDFSFYPVGGSYQASLPPNLTFITGSLPSSTQLTAFVDDNFLANEVLFDGYFLSTVPPSIFNSTDAANWPIAGTSFSSNPQLYINSNQPLPNSRLVYYNRPQLSPNGNPPSPYSVSPNIVDLEALDPASAGVSAKGSNIRKPAANLLISGAFNINSTSVPAWEALLSSNCSGNPIEYLNATVQTLPAPVSVTPALSKLPIYETAFLNLSTPISVGTITGQNPNPAFFGLVQLYTHSGNSYIASLAVNIVTQVQMRGPFLSLGDFLNHRLSSSANVLSNSGAVQAAIDSSSYQNVNPNDTVSNNQDVGGKATSNFTAVSMTINTVFPGGPVATVQPPAPNNSGYGIPGTLMQNDVVQNIAPVMAARSDTFMIRAYGEAINSGTGQTEAMAWCEAVVQRFPEYEYSMENRQFDSNQQANFAYDDPAAAPVVANTSGVTGLIGANYAFGRRFKIVSIRWLNQNEL